MVTSDQCYSVWVSDLKKQKMRISIPDRAFFETGCLLTKLMKLRFFQREGSSAMYGLVNNRTVSNKCTGWEICQKK